MDCSESRAFLKKNNSIIFLSNPHPASITIFHGQGSPNRHHQSFTNECQLSNNSNRQCTTPFLNVHSREFVGLSNTPLQLDARLAGVGDKQVPVGG